MYLCTDLRTWIGQRSIRWLWIVHVQRNIISWITLSDRTLATTINLASNIMVRTGSVFRDRYKSKNYKPTWHANSYLIMEWDGSTNDKSTIILMKSICKFQQLQRISSLIHIKSVPKVQPSWYTSLNLNTRI